MTTLPVQRRAGVDNLTVSRRINTIYLALYKRFGPQFWWPARTKFEVIVGAILTQNTNWINVEKALKNLKGKRSLHPETIYRMPETELASLIRPAGYFNIKAKRLKHFIHFFFAEYHGRLIRMKKEPLEILRPKLLSVNGVGPETADSILLYALNKPIFVIDAYTKRIVSRLNLIEADCDYQTLQKFFMNNLEKDIGLFNEYHALFVRQAKDFCLASPRCQGCPLREFCHFQD